MIQVIIFSIILLYLWVGFLVWIICLPESGTWKRYAKIQTLWIIEIIKGIQEDRKQWREIEDRHPRHEWE